jgi:hypothetical protein
MTTRQLLLETGISYLPASATQGSLQSLAYDATSNQLVAASDSGVSFGVNNLSGFSSAQSELRAFFSDFHADLSSVNTTELEVNAASDTEDVVYVINNFNDTTDIVTVYKLIPNPSLSGKWQITSFNIAPSHTEFNPDAAVVIGGTLYFGGKPSGTSNGNRSIVEYNYTTNSYPNVGTPAFTFNAEAGKLEGLSYDGTYLYGLIRASNGNLDIVEQWLWSATPADRVLVQVFDLYDVPVFKTLRDENVAEGRTASDGSWKPHAIEKTPNVLWVGNNSRNLLVDGVPVPANAYSVIVPTTSNLSSDIKFLTTLQQARNTNTSQPQVQKGIQIAGMPDSKNLSAITYSNSGAAFNGTSRVDLYGTNMVQTGGWSIAMTVVASAAPVSTSGALAIKYSSSNSYLRVNTDLSWLFRWNGVSMSSSVGNGPALNKQQRLFMEYDAVGGTLYLSVTDVNNAVPTVIASNSVSAPSEAPVKFSIGDKDTSGTPSPTNGGWVGAIKDFVIYNKDMNLRGSGVEPLFVNSATLITQNTWHGNPRGTVVYADSAYVNTVTSPYIKRERKGTGSIVPTYVFSQGLAPMVLTPAIPLYLFSLPYTTVVSLAWSVPLLPSGVWSQGTTLTFNVTNTRSPATESDTLTVTIPRNVTADKIPSVLAALINNSGTAFLAGSSGAILLISRLGFDNPSDNTACIFTSITITTP